MGEDSTAVTMAARLGQALLTARMRLVIAESCTGGGIGHLITAIAGSSGWFERGFVTYSNESKQELLAVPRDTLVRHGAVSEQTAAAMVAGAIHNSHADIGVAVTGIAGPGGGSEERPVGTVCFAWAGRDGGTKTTTVLFDGDRQQVRDQSILMAVQGLLDFVEATSSA